MSPMFVSSLKRSNFGEFSIILFIPDTDYAIRNVGF